MGAGRGGGGGGAGFFGCAQAEFFSKRQQAL